MEFIMKQKPNLKEYKKKAAKTYTEEYFELLSEAKKEEDDGFLEEPYDFEGKSVTIQENLKKVLDKFENLVDEDSLEREELISEAVENMHTISGSSKDKEGELVDDGLSE